jgi:hypothetical protein
MKFQKGNTLSRGRPKGRRNKFSRATLAELISDEVYRATLARRLRKGTCPPQVESAIWRAAVGPRPTQQDVEVFAEAVYRRFLAMLPTLAQIDAELERRGVKP